MQPAGPFLEPRSVRGGALDLQDTAAEVVEGLQGTSLFLVGMMGRWEGQPAKAAIVRSFAQCCLGAYVLAWSTSCPSTPCCCSGKSTVGKLISQALGYCFFDTGARQPAGSCLPAGCWPLMW